MWLSKKITENSGDSPFTAFVSFSDGSSVGLGSSSGSGSAALFLPYGIECVPPRGEQAVVVPSGRTRCAVGIRSKNSLRLEPGEIALYSKGGASIILKNDGRVLINGQEF